jgi:hypothetical protein
LVFFGAFAFGARASLGDPSCPLAIAAVPPASPRLSLKIFGRVFVKAGLEPIQQRGPGIPRFSASCEALPQVQIGRGQRAQSVCLLKHATAFGRVFGLSPRQAHFAFRFAAANASRAFEYR